MWLEEIVAYFKTRSKLLVWRDEEKPRTTSNRIDGFRADPHVTFGAGITMNNYWNTRSSCNIRFWYNNEQLLKHAIFV